MKKRGFTLIELLAVIVILAIIALIASPIVFNVIESSKKAAAERSVDNIKRAAELYYMNNRETIIESNGITFTCNSSGCINGDKKLEFNGTIPSGGTITISADGTIKTNNIVVDGHGCVDGVCGTNTVVENNTEIAVNDAVGGKLLNYQIYGNEHGLGNYNLCKLFDEENTSNGGCNGLNCIYYSSYDTDYDKFNMSQDGQITTTEATLIGFVVDVEPSTTYTASFNIKTSKGSIGMRIAEYKSLPTSISTKDSVFGDYTFNKGYNGDTGKKYNSFTTTEETEYVLFVIWFPKAGFVINQLQLVKGDVKQPYAPYGVYRIPITINNLSAQTDYNVDLTSPLSCNVSGVCDYIDYETKKVYRHDGTIESVELPEIKIPEGNSTVTIGTTIAPTKFNLAYE